MSPFSAATATQAVGVSILGVLNAVLELSAGWANGSVLLVETMEYAQSQTAMTATTQAQSYLPSYLLEVPSFGYARYKRFQACCRACDWLGAVKNYTDRGLTHARREFESHAERLHVLVIEEQLTMTDVWHAAEELVLV